VPNVQVIVPNGGVWGQPLRNFSTYPGLPHAGEVRIRISETANIDHQLTSLQYPIGWPSIAIGRFWLVQYVAGALISAIAISMGSPFWFDALQNLLKIRGTGPKPET